MIIFLAMLHQEGFGKKESLTTRSTPLYQHSSLKHRRVEEKPTVSHVMCAYGRINSVEVMITLFAEDENNNLHASLLFYCCLIKYQYYSGSLLFYHTPIICTVY